MKCSLSSFFKFFFFVFPFTFTLCSSCFYRYTQLQSDTQIHESFSGQCIRVVTVYLLFGYTIFFILLWSYITSTSLTFGWFLSPFGLTLFIFASFLYIKSYRLQMGHFRLSGPRLHTKNQPTNLSNTEDRNLLDANEMREFTTTEPNRRIPANNEKMRVS